MLSNFKTACHILPIPKPTVLAIIITIRFGKPKQKDQMIVQWSYYQLRFATFSSLVGDTMQIVIPENIMIRRYDK
jgi:hypothetical protein